MSSNSESKDVAILVWRTTTSSLGNWSRVKVCNLNHLHVFFYKRRFTREVLLLLLGKLSLIFPFYLCSLFDLFLKNKYFPHIYLLKHWFLFCCTGLFLLTCFCFKLITLHWCLWLCWSLRYWSRLLLCWGMQFIVILIIIAILISNIFYLAYCNFKCFRRLNDFTFIGFYLSIDWSSS